MRNTLISSVIAAVAMVLTGCASGPRQAAASLDHVSGPDPAHGVVVAKVCYAQGILIADAATGSETMHIGGSTALALRLSPGRYVIKEIGSGIGPFSAAEEPLTFEVVANRTTYIGTIKASWWYGDKYILECEAEGNRYTAQRDYKRRRIEPTPVWVVNDLPRALPALQLRYPNYKFDPIETRLIR